MSRNSCVNLVKVVYDSQPSADEERKPSKSILFAGRLVVEARGVRIVELG